MNTSDEIGAMFENAVTPFGKVNHIVQTGSRAYGLDTPDSDFDYRGIFVPNFSHLIGLKNCEQVKVNGDDWVCHSLPQFVKLVIKQNPTILEMLFIQPITVSYWTSKLIPHLKKLITKEVFKPYCRRRDKTRRNSLLLR